MEVLDLDKIVIDDLQLHLRLNLEPPSGERDVMLIQALHKVLQYYMMPLDYNYFVSHL